MKRQPSHWQGVKGALGATFNVMALSVMWTVSSLLVVTLPLTCTAAFEAMYYWSVEGDDRVVGNYIRGLCRDVGRRWLACGGVLVVGAAGVLEVAYFAGRGGLLSYVCAGLGAGSGLLAVGCVANVWLLLVTSGSEPVAEIWKRASGLAVRGVGLAPLVVFEVIVATCCCVADPGLLLVAVPGTFFWVVQWTARRRWVVGSEGLRSQHGRGVALTHADGASQARRAAPGRARAS